MFARKLSRLEKSLARAPDDGEAWLELARLVERVGGLPGFLEVDRHLPRLLELWRTRPEERVLAALVLPLLGLGPAGEGRGELPSFWRGAPRLREEAGERYDHMTGLPLDARRLVDGAPMVLVPAGPFELGSEEGGGDTRPVREIDLGGFYMDRYEVTVVRFQRFVAETRHPLPAVWNDEDGNQLLGPERPVVWVSWQDAVAYGEWVGARLPTEAEWEKAARGPAGQRFPWGEWPPTDRRANLNYARGGKIERTWHEALEKVSCRPEGASPYGVEDMVGNAFEWCADWYAADTYAELAATDPVGPARGERKVRRGCPTMYAPGKALPCWTRSSLPIGRIPNGDYQTGFRLVVPVPRARGAGGADTRGA